MARRRFHGPLHCAGRDSASPFDRICVRAFYGHAQTPLKASGETLPLVQAPWEIARPLARRVSLPAETGNPSRLIAQGGALCLIRKEALVVRPHVDSLFCRRCLTQARMVPRQTGMFCL